MDDDDPLLPKSERKSSKVGWGNMLGVDSPHVCTEDGKYNLNIRPILQAAPKI